MLRLQPCAKLGKCPFMRNEGIVFGNHVSEKRKEVYRAKVEVIE